MSKKNMGKIEYYTGIAYSPTNATKEVLRNVIRRFHEHKVHYHSNWMNKTMKIPRRMVFIENNYKNRQSAEKREKQIKRNGRKYKMKLINEFRQNNPYLTSYIDKYFINYARFCY